MNGSQVSAGPALAGPLPPPSSAPTPGAGSTQTGELTAAELRAFFWLYWRDRAVFERAIDAYRGALIGCRGASDVETVPQYLWINGRKTYTHSIEVKKLVTCIARAVSL